MPLMFDPASIDRYLKTMLQQEAPVSATNAEPASKPSIMLPALATAAGNAADVLTTWEAIKSGRAREGNPTLPQSPALIALAKAALTVPEVLAEKKLNDSGHPNWARGMGLALAGLGTGLAVHNARVGK